MSKQKCTEALSATRWHGIAMSAYAGALYACVPCGKYTVGSLWEGVPELVGSLYNALVRFTSVDNIAVQLNSAVGGVKRTAWVLMGDWKRHVNAAFARKVRLGHASYGASNDADASTNADAGANASPEHQDETTLELEPIPLTHEEKFVHNGQVLQIAMYGARTPDGLFVSITDVIHIIGVRSGHIPKFVTLRCACVSGEEVKVVSFEMLITLICATAHNYEVAAALRKWITAIVVAVQFSTETPVNQAVFAIRSSKGYSSKFYGFPNSREKHACLYLIEACPGRLALDLYPEQVSAVLPTGRNIDEFCVAKPGSSIDGRTRTSDNRTVLKKIFPGSDPLPVHTSAFPEISESEIVLMEKSAFVDDFEHRRIEGIRYRDGDYTELYLFDQLDIHAARISMDGHAGQYVREAIVAAKNDAVRARTDADQKGHTCDILQERLACRDRELTRSERENTQTHQRCIALEKEVSASREVARTELTHTRRAALSTMPAESAKIAAVFWGVSET